MKKNASGFSFLTVMVLVFAVMAAIALSLEIVGRIANARAHLVQEATRRQALDAVAEVHQRFAVHEILHAEERAIADKFRFDRKLNVPVEGVSPSPLALAVSNDGTRGYFVLPVDYPVIRSPDPGVGNPMPFLLKTAVSVVGGEWVTHPFEGLPCVPYSFISYPPVVYNSSGGAAGGEREPLIDSQSAATTLIYEGYEGGTGGWSGNSAVILALNDESSEGDQSLSVIKNTVNPVSIVRDISVEGGMVYRVSFDTKRSASVLHNGSTIFASFQTAKMSFMSLPSGWGSSIQIPKEEGWRTIGRNLLIPPGDSQLEITLEVSGNQRDFLLVDDFRINKIHTGIRTDIREIPSPALQLVSPFFFKGVTGSLSVGIAGKVFFPKGAYVAAGPTRISADEFVASAVAGVGVSSSGTTIAAQRRFVSPDFAASWGIESSRLTDADANGNYGAQKYFVNADIRIAFNGQNDPNTCWMVEGGSGWGAGSLPSGITAEMVGGEVRIVVDPKLLPANTKTVFIDAQNRDAKRKGVVVIGAENTAIPGGAKAVASNGRIWLWKNNLVTPVAVVTGYDAIALTDSSVDLRSGGVPLQALDLTWKGYVGNFVALPEIVSDGFAGTIGDPLHGRSLPGGFTWVVERNSANDPFAGPALSGGGSAYPRDNRTGYLGLSEAFLQRDNLKVGAVFEHATGGRCGIGFSKAGVNWGVVDWAEATAISAEMTPSGAIEVFGAPATGATRILIDTFNPSLSGSAPVKMELVYHQSEHAYSLYVNDVALTEVRRIDRTNAPPQTVTHAALVMQGASAMRATDFAVTSTAAGTALFSSQSDVPGLQRCHLVGGATVGESLFGDLDSLTITPMSNADVAAVAQVADRFLTVYGTGGNQ